MWYAGHASPVLLDRWHFRPLESFRPLATSKHTGLLNYLRMKLYPRLNPLPMTVQALNQHKGVNTKKKQVGDTEPVVVAPTRPEKWTPEEEFALSKVWVDVSEDPIVDSLDARVQINQNELDEEEEEDEIEDLTCPIGRDRAKADRARARRGSSSQPIPDYTQGMENLSQRIGDFNELKRERQRLVELQLLFTNTDHLTGIDREIAEREK
ncbi:hypothetical protein R6Q59_019061 [Mikania micrantha]